MGAEDGGKDRRTFLVIPCVQFLWLRVQSSAALLWASRFSCRTL
jgi:hypothetical protein